MKLKLLYEGKVVGNLVDVFESDETWFGRVQFELDSPKIVLEYVNLCIRWNERERSGLMPNPSEFEPYSDMVESKAWFIGSEDETIGQMDGAPVFFRPDEISWRMK